MLDTGPLVSLIHAGEGRRHSLARGIIEPNRGSILVPWPVYVEADLLLRSRGHSEISNALGHSLLSGELTLVAPSPVEHASALRLLGRYGDIGLDLPDAVVMAMVDARTAVAFTWDFRHFRAVVFRRGKSIPLLVNESELP